jgi:transcriptional regulator with XRE-family HTH domain
MAVLLREAIGDRLRHARTTQRRTLREVSRAARVSLGYLSEVERGRKEASSELLAAICAALDLPLPELLGNIAADLKAMHDVDLAGLPAPAPRAGRSAPTIDVCRMPSALAESEQVDIRLHPALRHRLSASISASGRPVPMG